MMILVDKEEFLKLRTPGNFLTIILYKHFKFISSSRIKGNVLSCCSIMPQ